MFHSALILKVVELSGSHVVQLQVHVPSVLFPNYSPVHQVSHSRLIMRHISATWPVTQMSNLTPRCTSRFLSKARQGVYGLENECSVLEGYLKLIVAEDGRPPLSGNL